MNKDTRLSGVLHVLLHLGQVTAPQTSELMAKAMGTNAAVFRRTMAGLREAGYVRSEKGHGGGWSLAKPLTEITLFDVYRALGQPGLFAIGSRNEQSGCKVEQAVNVALSATLTKAEAIIVEQLASIKLASLIPANSRGAIVHSHGITAASST
ncbi:Rrf2 family transcriptional regulator [Devosia sp. RR2S18]|uniref:Rrf2 family transcriptional regulator n=1 Tax=Devosia rhizosphaerae TaxID=3049774 RepID=UPI0025409AAE|nr:Rrf2 family transcriptional regulator [Devosia sp. RR2S18]WIJ26411.1 Rrf2 family transcriptional regulator [Devosia sp. RR2S18]